MRALAERAGDLAYEAHLDVSAGQGVSHNELPALQSAVDVPEVIGNLALDARRQRRRRFTQARDLKVEHQRQHRRALGIVHPLHVLVIRRTVGRGLQAAAAVTAYQVVDYRA